VAVSINALGDYLRARREQIRPEDVGLFGGARRRVPGLRREELALLAGISVDYYLRLEQGRDKHPSAEVVNALSSALNLDVKATEYLHQLAAPRAARAQPVSGEAAADGTAEVIDQFSMPAIVVTDA
jgi:transcriptional regulator with XRE-family HTH domain